MPKYTIWTIGCQMNKAESRQIADCLEAVGYEYTSILQKADLVVLNTCVVRQSAENKALGMLGYMRGTKRDNPDKCVVVTGCLVDSQTQELKKRFPQVSFFFKPGAHQELLEWARQNSIPEHSIPENIHYSNGIKPTAFVPIIQGCNNFCSYCIVPYRRGREQSRSIEEIVIEVANLISKGVKEVTLLGQNVNSYGHDLLKNTDLSVLLQSIHTIDGLERIRFLTNHPKNMSLKLIETMAHLDRVCEHITIPLQSGDDAILKAMRRDYTAKQYCNLVDTIRSYIPGVAISTDIIVGFPSETDGQFDQTMSLIKQIRFDTVHIAAYSPRQGTVACREFEDNVPAEVKRARVQEIEATQTQIANEINAPLKGTVVEVLVEGKKQSKWYGRTRKDKLVFFEGRENCLGKLVNISVTKTSPWALQGEVKN